MVEISRVMTRFYLVCREKKIDLKTLTPIGLLFMCFSTRLKSLEPIMGLTHLI